MRLGCTGFGRQVVLVLACADWLRFLPGLSLPVSLPVSLPTKVKPRPAAGAAPVFTLPPLSLTSDPLCRCCQQCSHEGMRTSCVWNAAFGCGVSGQPCFGWRHGVRSRLHGSRRSTSQHSRSKTRSAEDWLLNTRFFFYINCDRSRQHRAVQEARAPTSAAREQVQHQT